MPCNVARFKFRGVWLHCDREMLLRTMQTKSISPGHRLGSPARFVKTRHTKSCALMLILILMRVLMLMHRAMLIAALELVYFISN